LVPKAVTILFFLKTRKDNSQQRKKVDSTIIAVTAKITDSNLEDLAFFSDFTLP
jgi:hypothetical protein